MPVICCGALHLDSLGIEGLFRFEAIRLCVYIRRNKTGFSPLAESERQVRAEPGESRLFVSNAEPVAMLGAGFCQRPEPSRRGIGSEQDLGLDVGL